MFYHQVNFKNNLVYSSFYFISMVAGFSFPPAAVHFNLLVPEK